MVIKHSVRCVGFIASSLGIIQAIVWLVLTVSAILIHFDAWEPKYDRYSYGNYLGLVIQKGYINGDGFTNSTISPHEIFIYSVSYITASSVWLVFSSYLLWASLRQKVKFASTAYVVWGIWTCCICIGDAIMTIFLILDYITIVTHFNEIKRRTTENYFEVLACAVVIFVVSRGFLLWIVNLAFAVTTVRLGWKSSLDEPADDNSISKIISAFEKPSDPKHLTRSNSFVSSKSFGTFRGLPRIPFIQSTNETLSKIMEQNTRISMNFSSMTRSTSTFLYPDKPESPEHSQPKSPPQPPLKSALKNGTGSLYNRM